MLSVSTVVVTLAAGSAQAADPKKAREKIVELNKQALLSYEAKDFETARDLLTKALKEAKVAGLEDDKMTARTYLHLGAVYWVGFQDQAVALQNFSLAKKIRPDIQLTPSIETADLKSVFDMAAAEVEPTPAPAPGRPVAPVRPQPRALPPAAPAGPRLMGDDGGEPDLPAAMSAPLMCTVPQDFVPPNKELTIRCALKPGINASKGVQIHYRAPGVEAYQALGMRKTAKGWYIVTLPSNVMKAGTLQVYFDARDTADNELASNGQIDSPSVIEVRKKGSGKSGRGREEGALDKINQQAMDEKYEAGLHRRREGAFWIGVGGGAGWGFVPAGNLEWEKYKDAQQVQRSVKVSAMTTTTGLFHLLPEIGYMWGENFALALQGRIEFIQQQQATYKDPNTGNIVQLAGSINGAPSTIAPAAFLRAIWYTDLSSGGNLQFSYSGDVGGGFIRFPVKPVAVAHADPNGGDPIVDWSKTIAKTDTRPMGLFLVGASGGLVWHLSRHFAFALEGRFLTGLPNYGAVVEGNFSAQLAFGGVKGPAPEEEEGVVEGEGGAIKDEPPPVEESSSEE
jgi:hypothetical protein